MLESYHEHRKGAGMVPTPEEVADAIVQKSDIEEVRKTVNLLSRLIAVCDQATSAEREACQSTPSEPSSTSKPR
jgi:hypothetical protein